MHKTGRQLCFFRGKCCKHSRIQSWITCTLTCLLLLWQITNGHSFGKFSPPLINFKDFSPQIQEFFYKFQGKGGRILMRAFKDLFKALNCFNVLNVVGGIYGFTLLNLQRVLLTNKEVNYIFVKSLQKGKRKANQAKSNILFTCLCVCVCL